MKKHHSLFVLLAGFGFLCSCGEDPYHDNVAFKAELVSRSGASNEAFAIADAIGIFEITANGTLPASLVADENPNEKYLVADAANGALTPEMPNTALEYPKKGAADFIAYHPYRATPVTGDPYLITVRLDRQTSLDKQQACDLLYSNNAKGHSKSPNVPVILQFKHALAKIQINITFGEGMLGLTPSDLTSITLVNMPDSVTLKLADGTTVAGAVTNEVTKLSPLAITPATGAIATYTAIIAPQETGVNRRIVCIADGEDYIVPIPDTVPLQAGMLYIYNVLISKTSVQVEASITPWTVIPGTGTAN